jgi:hypothetical protein
MNWVDLLVIVFLSLTLVALLLFFVLKKARGEKLTGCDCSKGSGAKIVKAYHREKAKEAEAKGHCPHCRP